MANEMIRFENVHKWFKDLHVINGVNLDIAKGEVVVVCGPSGSGKSTLIRTVNQLETIQDGNIYVLGSIIGRFPSRDFVRLIKRPVNLLQAACNA